MATYYDQTFNYGGETFDIRVDMHTSTRDVGDKKEWLNTITVNNWDGTVTTEDVPDGDVQARCQFYQKGNEVLIDGIPNTKVDEQLIADGYTRH